MGKIEELYKEWQDLQPVKEEYLQRLNRKFMLEFNYNSNHIEGNTLTYGQTELLLLFGKVVDAANMKDLEDMKASNVGLNMMQEQAASEYPLTETFIRQLHKTILREDYTVYRQLPDGQQTSYVVHAGVYKTRPNSVITRTGERFEYASPEETSALMTDLVEWYRAEEQKGELTLAELCALFHYRYIRIHPFEDGNGRIARLLVNFILTRHHYPMVVVKSADKENYLNALNACDGFVGTSPSEGAHADITKIAPFVRYIEECMERALITCIRAAKGLSIEEDDDFMKELKVLERQKKQDIAAELSNRYLHEEEVWNIMELVFSPIVQEFNKSVETANTVFKFKSVETISLLSQTQDGEEGVGINGESRETASPELLEAVKSAKSLWYHCQMTGVRHPKDAYIVIEKSFYITFFDDHYFVDGILNKNFAYGSYPSEKEKGQIVEQFKQDIIAELKEKL